MGMSSWGCRPGPEDSRGLSGRHDVGEWQCGGGKAVQGAPRPPPRGPGTPARGASTMGVKGGLCGRPGGRAPTSNEGAPAAGTSEGCAGAAVGPAVVDSEGGGGPAVTDGGSCGSSGSGLNDGGGGGWGNATDPGWFYHVLGAAALPLGNPWDDRSKRGGGMLGRMSWRANTRMYGSQVDAQVSPEVVTLLPRTCPVRKLGSGGQWQAAKAWQKCMRIPLGGMLQLSPRGGRWVSLGGGV